MSAADTQSIDSIAKDIAQNILTEANCSLSDSNLTTFRNLISALLKRSGKSVNIPADFLVEYDNDQMHDDFVRALSLLEQMLNDSIRSSGSHQIYEFCCMSSADSSSFNLRRNLKQYNNAGHVLIVKKCSSISQLKSLFSLLDAVPNMVHVLLVSKEIVDKYIDITSTRRYDSRWHITLCPLLPLYPELPTVESGLTRADIPRSISDQALSARSSQDEATVSSDEATTSSDESAIILFLSSSQLKPAKVYPSPSGKKYNGIFSNDAPVQYLLDCIYQRSLTDSVKIICLTSFDDMTKPIDGYSDTMYTRFHHLIETYMQNIWPGIPVPVILPVPYDYEVKISDVESGKCPNTASVTASHAYNGTDSSPVSPAYGSMDPDDYEKVTDTRTLFAPIFRRISTYLKNTRHVYVDYTGGLRDVGFLMVAIIRFLELNDRQCEEIIYSSLKPSQIVNIQNIYEMFESITGTSEFISSGNARALNSLYENNEKARSLICALNTFSDQIAMCNLEDFDKTVEELNKSLEDFKSDPGDDLQGTMLFSLLPTMERKLFNGQQLILPSDLPGAPNVINYIPLIRWCLDNRLYQQALTFYIEKMPMYYFRTGKLSDLVDLDNVKVGMGSSREATAFYTNLYTAFIPETENSPQDELRIKLLELHRKLTEPNELGITQSNWSRKKNRVIAEIQSTFDSPVRDRLCQIINEFYPDFRRNCDFLIYGQEIKQNTFITFLKTAAQSAQSAQIHYLLYYDNAAFDQLKAASAKTGDKNSRYSTIQLIADGKARPVSDPDSMICILAAYLAAKLLRNRLNHAAEDPAGQSASDSDTAAAGLESLSRSGKLPGMWKNIAHPKEPATIQLSKITSESVIDIITNGLNISEKLGHVTWIETN